MSGIGGSDEAPPSPLDALRLSRAETAAAREAERAKDQQLELMTAMLQAAEEELKLRSNQLDLTNAMLRATEAEVVRKDEQLEITTQMLRKAEEEIREQDRVTTAMRRELASTRDSLGNATRRAAGGVSDGSAGCGRAQPLRVTAPMPAPASAMARDQHESALHVAAALADAGTRIAGAGAALPIDLPEQQHRADANRQSSHAQPPPRIALVHGDQEESMHRSWMRDARATVLDYVNVRESNKSLPETRTSMRPLEDDEPRNHGGYFDD